MNRTVLIKLLVMATWLFLSGPLMSAPLSISWVSTDVQRFSPGKQQTLSLRYRLSSPSRVRIDFFNVKNDTVYSYETTFEKSGDMKYLWDGKDAAGKIVPPGAYMYTITAEKDDQSVVYDMRPFTGGETLYPRGVRMEKNGAIHYQLDKAARVRLIVSGEDHYWPIATLMDWASKDKGQHVLHWDGWDADHRFNALKTSHKLVPIIYTYALPSNAIIVEGEPVAPVLVASKDNNTRVPDNREKPGREQHLHARHPYAMCYAPEISIDIPGEEKNLEGRWRLSKPATIRFDISDRQPADRMPPIRRHSVFIYVNGVLVDRLLSGYSPYQWNWDPRKYGEGEHIITALFTWREDHFGIEHTIIQVPAGSLASQNDTPSIIEKFNKFN